MNAGIIILCLIWGFNFVIMKWGNDYFPPGEFAALRFSTGALVLLGVSFIKRVPLPSKSDLKWLILCGIFQTTYFNIAIQVSLNHIDAGLTSVLTYSMPLFLTLMAHQWIPNDRLTTRKMVGIIVGIIGLFLAMNIQLDGSILIMLFALSSAVSWATANLLLKLKLQHCNAVQYTTWQMTIGTIGLWAYTLLFEQGTESQWELTSIFYILFAGVIASALAFVMWSYILKHTEASKASTSILLVPIVGVISGVILLDETLSIITVAGIALVLTGVYIVNGKSLSKKQAIKHSTKD